MFATTLSSLLSCLHLISSESHPRPPWEAPRAPPHSLISSTLAEIVHTHPSLCRCNTIKYLHNLSPAAIGPKRLHFPNGNLGRMFLEDRRDVTTPGISEWEDFYRNYAQGKKAINILMDSMFYSWHLFRLGHGRAHTEPVPGCEHMVKTAISFFIHLTNYTSR